MGHRMRISPQVDERPTLGSCWNSAILLERRAEKIKGKIVPKNKT